MYFRHLLDLEEDDLCWLTAELERPTDADASEARVRSAWACDPEELLVTMSVRSAWHLLLGVSGWEAGDEVVMSGVTIPAMGWLPEAHGLRVVPVDLDPGTLHPDLGAVEAAIGPRTRAVLVAHLYGSRLDVGPLAQLCRQRGVMLIEDCAQAFVGPHWAGHAEACVSFFSFGMVKTMTALGGAVTRVRDPALRSALQAAQRAWPVQTREVVDGRIAAAGTFLSFADPGVYGEFVAGCASAGRDLDETVNGSVRGFPGTDLTRQISARLSPPLMSLLARRLERFDGGRTRARAARGEHLLARLPAGLVHPGGAAPLRTHWLFPVVCDDPIGLRTCLRSAGFDAAPGTTSIAAVVPTGATAVSAPQRARRWLSRATYLPVYPELPDAALARLLKVLEFFAGADLDHAATRVGL